MVYILYLITKSLIYTSFREKYTVKNTEKKITNTHIDRCTDVLTSTVSVLDQDSKWVEEKQLFLRRNQELLEKVRLNVLHKMFVIVSTALLQKRHRKIRFVQSVFKLFW